MIVNPNLEALHLLLLGRVFLGMSCSPFLVKRHLQSERRDIVEFAGTQGCACGITNKVGHKERKGASELHGIERLCLCGCELRIFVQLGVELEFSFRVDRVKRFDQAFWHGRLRRKN